LGMTVYQPPPRWKFPTAGEIHCRNAEHKHEN